MIYDIVINLFFLVAYLVFMVMLCLSDVKDQDITAIRIALVLKDIFFLLFILGMVRMIWAI